MKSIKDTLNLVSDIVSEVDKTTHVSIALIGGYAVIAHGVGRTTIDVDFFIYSENIQENAPQFIELFKRAFSGRFKTRWVEGSKMLGDPFPYDILFVNDQLGEYPRMDFIVPRYKWELEGLRNAKKLKDVAFPVISNPYLIAMKLKAGGPSDHSDIIELYKLLSDDEKEKVTQLAARIKRNKNLEKILNATRIRQEEPDDNDLLI